ncbi:MAG: DUF2335 domain-containing protein [Candidatus Methylomirabilia bacterium]
MAHKLPPDRRPQVVTQTIASQHLELRSGPLPPPEDLARYNQVVPGFAERIVVMAESEISHRHSQESRSIDADVAANKSVLIERKIGQAMAFVIAMTVIGIGGFLVYSGHPIAGTIFGGLGLAPVVTAFIPDKSLGLKRNAANK